MKRTEKLLNDLSDFINEDPGTTFLKLEAIWPGSGDSPYYEVLINARGASSTSIEKAVREAMELNRVQGPMPGETIQ